MRISAIAPLGAKHRRGPRLSPGLIARTLIRSAVGAAAFVLSAGAGAQDPLAQPDAQDPDKLDMIVVEGRRTAQYTATQSGVASALGDRSLLDTPFSVNVITEELIADQQASLLLEVLRNDPSSVAGFGAGVSSVQTVSLRGYALNFDSNYRRDGLPFAHFSELPFETLGRVEVLKGLSGFLYGFAAPGGIVNVVPKKPTGQPLRTLSTGYTSESLFALRGDAGGRFGNGGQFGYRINLGGERGNAAIRDVEVDRWFGSAYLDWRITSDLTLALDFERQRRSPTGQPLYYALPASVQVPSPPDLRRFNGISYATYETDDVLLGLSADWRFAADWRIEARFLDYSNERDAWFSQGTINNANGDLTVRTQRDSLQEYPAQSFQALIDGRFRTGKVHHEVTFGVNRNQSERFRGDYVLAPEYASNLYAPVDAEPQNLLAAQPKYRNADADELSWFVSDTVSFGDRLQLIGGLRRTTLDQRNFDREAATIQRYDRGATTPSAAAIFKPRQDMALYVSYAEGLEQGGIAPASADNAGETFAPLESEQVEAGVKWQRDSGLAVNFALFDIDKGLSFVDTGSNLFVQEGRQTHRGGELTLAGRLMPRLDIVAGTMWLDAEAVHTGNLDVDGRRPVNVPRQTANLYADYRLASLPGLALNLGYQYVGSRYVDATNARQIGSVGLVNLGLRYVMASGDRTVTLRANIDNVADENYWAAATPTLHAGLPRTFKLSIQIE